MRKRKPIGPGTEKTYRKVLLRAFGPPPYRKKASDLGTWAQSSLKILNAAALKYAPERLNDLPDIEFAVERVIQPPTEAELAAFELQAATLEPALRSMLLMPLKLGLRSAELLNLQRVDVQRATEGAELLVLGKGGRERLLPSSRVQTTLKNLLAQPEWTVSWEILSPTSERAAYQTLYRMIQDLGARAKVKGLRPHKLRHGFATRMERSGADLSQIQKMMGHKNPEMTSRYVHPENRGIVQHLQEDE